MMKSLLDYEEVKLTIEYRTPGVHGHKVSLDIDRADLERAIQPHPDVQMVLHNLGMDAIELLVKADKLVKKGSEHGPE